MLTVFEIIQKGAFDKAPQTVDKDGCGKDFLQPFLYF